MKNLVVVALSLCAVTPLVCAQSFVKVSETENVVMKVRPAEQCAATFQFTNHNPYPVIVDFKGEGYSTDGSTMPYLYSGSVRVRPGQSVSRPMPAPRSNYCSLDKVGGRMVVRSALNPRTAPVLSAKSHSSHKPAGSQPAADKSLVAAR